VLEGAPKKLLAAMSTELAVIASRVPGMAEFVEDGKTGVLVDNEVGAWGLPDGPGATTPTFSVKSGSQKADIVDPHGGPM